MQYPPNARIIRTMCSGRVAPKFIERAFARGAASVLVSGCHLGDCHYINANYQTQKRVERLWKKMEQNGLGQAEAAASVGFSGGRRKVRFENA